MGLYDTPPAATTPASDPADHDAPGVDTTGLPRAVNLSGVDTTGLPRAVNLSDSTIRRLRKQGLFPAPVRLSARRLMWTHASLRDWLATRQAGDR